MTAWQDEPPLTRRQMRMREREGASAPAHEDEAPTTPAVESAAASSAAAQPAPPDPRVRDPGSVRCNRSF